MNKKITNKTVSTKKTKIILIAACTIAVASVTAAVITPLVVLLPKHDKKWTQGDIKGNEWDINDEVSLNTDQIMNWVPGYWGDKSKLIQKDYQTGGQLQNDPTMLDEVQSEFVTWTLLDCMVQMIFNHANDQSNYMPHDGLRSVSADWVCSLQIRGLHVRKSDHKFRIDFLHYMYGQQYTSYNFVDRYANTTPGKWCDIVSINEKKDMQGNFIKTIKVGSTTETSWDILDKTGGTMYAKSLSTPLNYVDANNCKFPNASKIEEVVVDGATQGSPLSITTGSTDMGTYVYCDYGGDYYPLDTKYTIDVVDHPEFSSWLSITKSGGGNSTGNIAWTDVPSGITGNYTFTVTASCSGYDPNTSIVHYFTIV